MRSFLTLILLIIELVGFIFTSMFIGLWWIQSFIQTTQGGADGSLLRATGGLVIAAVMFYKFVIAPRRNRTPLHFYFYTALAVCAVVGYLYGVFFRWE